MSRLKNQADIDAMRESGAILKTVLDYLEANLAIGQTSKDLALMAASELQKLGGEPAFKGVKGPPGVQDFPDVICISISEEVQHGIPSNRVIKDGDVVNFDFGVRYRGMVTDSGRTLAVGNISSEAKRLLTGTSKALDAAIAEVKAGVSVAHLSAVIEDVLSQHKLGIVLELVGHGVGFKLHEPPEIPNYRVRMPTYKLQVNETIAIEPIATLGSGEIIFSNDGWTILSKDRTLASQHEHTLLVTESGCEILTA